MCSKTDLSRRQFLQKAISAVVGLGILSSIFPFLRSWLPSERTLLSEAPVRCDISALEPGDLMTVLWQGKPVWILRRTSEMIQSLALHVHQLRDPNSIESSQPDNTQNNFRSLQQEYFVAIGQCTHMGCIPMLKNKAFICPCHGSRFDLAGRVVKGVPAPRNLDVPPYHFADLGKTIVIGEA